jgi:predicted  nucleic acid-binding Zn-ribbon protein
MIEILSNLLQLQQIDNELAVLENKSKDMPRRIEGIRLFSETKKNELQENQHNIIEFKKKYKLLEVDLKEAEEKIGQYSAQLYSAKTNDQYKAFLKEIESSKKEKMDIEDKLIEVLETIENTEKEVKQLQSELTDIEAETKEKTAILKKEEESIHHAIKERIKTRETICEVIGKETLAIYEKIKKGKGGIAVVTVDGERCQGCLNPLPPQQVLEIKKNERIYFCEYCGRITISPENINPNQS